MLSVLPWLFNSYYVINKIPCTHMCPLLLSYNYCLSLLICGLVVIILFWLCLVGILLLCCVSIIPSIVVLLVVIGYHYLVVFQSFYIKFTHMCSSLLCYWVLLVIVSFIIVFILFWLCLVGIFFCLIVCCVVFQLFHPLLCYWL